MSKNTKPDKKAIKNDSEARKDALKALFAGFDGYADIIEPLIDDVVFLEENLKELRALPMIRVCPSNPAKQKATPSSKLYKEFLQQYNNCIKILEGILKQDTEEDVSPLREWVKANANS